MELNYANNPRSLFRKYAHLVTWFANTGIGKDFLDLPKEPITLLLPNGYHKIVEPGKSAQIEQLRVYPRAFYAYKMIPALFVVDMISSFMQDFSEAQQVLAYQLGLINSQPAILRAFNFRASLAIKPDANPETTTVDGWVGRGAVNETWATIRAGAGNEHLDADPYALSWAQSSGTSNQWGYLRRLIALFDCTSFPAGAVLIPGANTMAVYNSGVTTDYYLTQRLVATTPASNTVLANGDFANTGTTSQATADVDMSGLNQYHTFTMATAWESAFTAAVQKLGVKITNDATNSAPAWVSAKNYGNNLLAVDAGVGVAPVLTLAYTMTKKVIGTTYATTKKVSGQTIATAKKIGGIV